MNEEILKRKGARKVNEVPKEVLELLNKGLIETVNLIEWLTLDQIALIENTFPKIGLKEVIVTLKDEIVALKKPTSMSIIKAIGPRLYGYCSDKNNVESIYERLSTHTSDTVRSYAPYLIALNSNFTIKQKLGKVKNCVADKHFGVREVVWMALRSSIELQLQKAIKILSQWTNSKDENIRRFTTEVTRPRGVWCKHIEILKEQPELGLPILEPLKSDRAKYVQDSVGNWLNDASKSQPKFVDELCNKWMQESPTKATEKIVKRARRTLDKK